VEKGSRYSPSSIIAIFHSSDLLFLPQSEVRAGKLLVDTEHFQEEELGVAPTITTEGLAATVL
jgi:hypothetical protein